MKTFIVACLLSAATLSNARDNRRLGSNLGAVGGINGELRAGVEQLGPHGGPGYTASIGAGVGARLGGQGSLGLGGYGQGYAGSFESSWGGAYGASPYGGYAHYGVPYGGGYYGSHPYGDDGLYSAYNPRGVPGGYGGYSGYGGYHPYGGSGAYGYHAGNSAFYGWGVPSHGARSGVAVPRILGGPAAGTAGASGSAPSAAHAA
uniref:Putative glycine rich protein n=1 Tax=Rhipicephalus pulchellus TaxID=72859 RepID=L7M1G1_RHIPC